MKKYLFFLVTLLSTFSFSQKLESNSTDDIDTFNLQESDSLDLNKVKRISLGIKLGIPNIAGFSLEGISPFLGNRIAPYIDYSSFPVNTNETDVDLKYLEFGSNFYFGKNGKGFYTGIGFGALNTDIIFKDLEFEENGNRGRGSGSISTKISTTNLKVGIKTGGRVYFRLEVGYGIGTIPKNVIVEGKFTYKDSNGITRTESGSETEKFPIIPGVNDNGVLVGNFGFGVSF
tara:strand:- start:499 stop:1191 length:693 start_codon:yes stop_codon:yes gene_type:complete